MINFAMFSGESGTQLMWGIYLAAAIALCVALWRLTRRWQPDIRWLLLALIAVFLFVPAPVPGQDSSQAPAMIFVLLSPMTGAPEDLAAVLVRLMFAAAIAVLVVIAAGVWRRLRRRRA